MTNNDYTDILEAEFNEEDRKLMRQHRNAILNRATYPARAHCLDDFVDWYTGRVSEIIHGYTAPKASAKQAPKEEQKVDS